MPLRGSRAEPIGRRSIVGLHTVAVLIEDAESRLGALVAHIGGLHEQRVSIPVPVPIKQSGRVLP